MPLPQWQFERLKTVQVRLRSLTGEPVGGCAIAPEHKEAVRLYVQTWILPHVDVVLGETERNGLDDLGDGDRERRGIS
jgi:hypothetical protein